MATNAYKVWAGDSGYMIILASTPLNAKLSYWSEIASAREMFEKGADTHCHLIEKDVESRNETEYQKSRYYDLIFAGITHPDWAADRMVYDWWYEE